MKKCQLSKEEAEKVQALRDLLPEKGCDFSSKDIEMIYNLVFEMALLRSVTAYSEEESICDSCDPLNNPQCSNCVGS